MSVMQLVDFIKQIQTGIDVYPYSFPFLAKDSAIIVEAGEGIGSWSEVNDIILTMTVRAIEQGESENIAIELIDKLDYLTNFETDNLEIAFIKSKQTIPRYMGVDDSKRHYFSVNFKVLSKNKKQT